MAFAAHLKLCRVSHLEAAAAYALAMIKGEGTGGAWRETAFSRTLFVFLIKMLLSAAAAHWIWVQR